MYGIGTSCSGAKSIVVSWARNRRQPPRHLWGGRCRSPASPFEYTERRVRREASMSQVRVLVGTRKGAFVLASEEKRKRGDVGGPHLGGWDISPQKASPADPNRLYASQSSAWFGQLIQRSSDGGKTWEAVGNKFAYEGTPGTHLWYDGTPRPWEFTRVWHLEPSLTDPDTVYAGIQDAALFRTGDGGQTWQELPGLRNHASASSWQPGAGGVCLHTILLDPAHPQRIFISLSAAATGERSGRRSRRGCPRATATSTCCATRWPWTRSIRAACTSAPPVGRCTSRPTRAIAGSPSFGISPP